MVHDLNILLRYPYDRFLFHHAYTTIEAASPIVMISRKPSDGFPGYSLFVTGGRLHGIANPHDLRHHALIERWLSGPGGRLLPLRALESGHLEFEPGQWWMHPIFAFHDGIMDDFKPQGGICADEDGVYAITLSGSDELSCTEDTLTYRCPVGDQGCHPLLGGILPPKQPIRILRTHAVHSQWSPSAGVRYEGLYKISGYSVKSEKGRNELIIDVKLAREPNQAPMKEVIKHPTTEEVEDYVQWKRLKRLNLQTDDGSPSSL